MDVENLSQVECIGKSTSCTLGEQNHIFSMQTFQCMPLDGDYPYPSKIFLPESCYRGIIVQVGYNFNIFVYYGRYFTRGCYFLYFLYFNMVTVD